jgi:hypothetical protein
MENTEERSLFDGIARYDNEHDDDGYEHGYAHAL